MTVFQALAAFTLAAGLLTLTPGLDTALVLRTAALEGPRRAALAVVGILSGCFVWGGLVAFGLGAVLAASSLAFDLLKWAGAAYLVWLGIGWGSTQSLGKIATETGHGPFGLIFWQQVVMVTVLGAVALVRRHTRRVPFKTSA